MYKIFDFTENQWQIMSFQPKKFDSEVKMLEGVKNNYIGTTWYVVFIICIAMRVF
jgi:hypothetical protein